MTDQHLDVNFELAIETYSVDQLPQFISDHSGIATAKFWHGLSAMHKLVMRVDCSVECIAALCKAGADVNDANNFGETCLMFAAKRGSPRICDYLIQQGADIERKDNAGRSVIHHAVLGGSIATTHFLHVAYGCQLKAADNRKQTCLHIAASQGNEAMTKYLLQFDRSDASYSDVFGNTALHTAANYGHDRSVYQILHLYGLSPLLKKNTEGKTPIDMCQGMDVRHKSTRDMMQVAHNELRRGSKFIQPPRLLLVWYALMPAVIFLIGCGMGHIVQYFLGWYTGMVTVGLSVVYILYLFVIHTHRIKHFSKMPNPMYAGTFGAGLIGTFVTWCVRVAPHLSQASLLPQLFFVMLLAPPLFYLYFSLLTQDPGYLPLPSAEMSQATGKKLLNLKEGSVDRYCDSCNLVTSGNIKHCKLCERCVINMDHHCLFLLRCVASLNHKKFTIFIMLTNVAIVFFILSTRSYYYNRFFDLSSYFWSWIVAEEDLFLLWVVILNILSLVWGLTLVWWNLKFISYGFTYYESLRCPEQANSQTLTLYDRIMNVVRFFIGQKQSYKETIIGV